MTFPYISQIQVNNCYTYQDFAIPAKPLEGIKHIVLTGKNGSGKTTILDGVSKSVAQFESYGFGVKADNDNVKLSLVSPDDHTFGGQITDENIFSYFKAHRKVVLTDVNTVTKEEDFLTALQEGDEKQNFVSHFKQYLVNKKVYEAFDYMKDKTASSNTNKSFFDHLTEVLRSIFDDYELELEFVQENFEFYLVFADERRVTFDQLSEGFSAFLSILMDLLMKTDLIRKAKKDYSFEPEGIVLIDEPETHFHLSMQYQILPLLTNLFPRIQFIVATHSPAIISSIKNAIVYDISSKEEVSDWVLGSSFSELMIKHFGLDNEYSAIADQIISAVSQAVKAKDVDKLQNILTENEPYLTPSLRLEIESQIIHLQSSVG